MTRKCVVVVDNSNVFIEGRKYSARMKGKVRRSATELEPRDPSWRLDFGGLLFAVSDGRVVEHAILVGSRPPQNDSVWKAAEDSGFDVTVHDRSVGEEKAVDTELVAQATERICMTSNPMDLAIVSGDRDFIPLVNVAHRHKWFVEMWAFTNAFNVAGQMATSVDKVQPLDAVFGKIGRCEFNWP
jgi:hypothetical protein